MESKKTIFYKIKRITENVEVCDTIGEFRIIIEDLKDKEKLTTIKIINNVETEKNYVLYDKTKFKPVESFNRLAIENGFIEFRAEFLKKSIKMTADGPLGPKYRILDRSDDVYDNTQIFSLLKYINLSAEDTFELKLFSNPIGRCVECEMNNFGSEILEINGIKYNALRVALTSVVYNISQFYLFSDDADKNLLKTIVGNEILEFERIEREE